MRRDATGGSETKIDLEPAALLDLRFVRRVEGSGLQTVGTPPPPGIEDLGPDRRRKPRTARELTQSLPERRVPTGHPVVVHPNLSLTQARDGLLVLSNVWWLCNAGATSDESRTARVKTVGVVAHPRRNCTKCSLRSWDGRATVT